MSKVRYSVSRNQKPTPEQVAMIEAACKREYTYDTDSPETDPEKTPERYAAMMNAVAERNRRIAELAKSSA